MAHQQNEETYRIVHKYWKIASDSKYHSLLCEDKTCLQFLVFVLDDSSQEIISKSLMTLLLLCEKSENRKKLFDTYGLLQSLELLLSNRNNSKEILDLADKLLDVMNTVAQQTEEKGITHPFKDIANCLEHEGTEKQTNPTSKSFFLGRANSKAKTLVFYIQDLLTKEDCRLCENELIRIKGVISITFNLSKKQCIVRAKADLKPEIIARALFDGNVRNVQQVIKDHKGEESLISFDGGEGKENKNSLPEYLSEEDSPVKDNSVTVKGCGKEHEGSTWFNSACDFLVRSFYW